MSAHTRTKSGKVVPFGVSVKRNYRMGVQGAEDVWFLEMGWFHSSVRFVRKTKSLKAGDLVECLPTMKEATGTTPGTTGT